jgi:dTDP-glucose 4,6-dehydratase
MNPLASDLESILQQTRGLWEELRGQRLFITGGTGFFGCWLLESFAWANDRLDLNAQAVVLSRRPEVFREKVPRLAAHPAIELQRGDVLSFDFPPGRFSHVIHAATEATGRLTADNPLLVFDTIVAGTRRTLEFARCCGARKFLLTSSGAVYGRQPQQLTHVSEEYRGGPDPTDPGWAYGEGKRTAEMLCALFHREYGLETKIARCFAFVGPYLPLNQHFAVGNFIRDATEGRPVAVHGDGSTVRSYLYASDLVVWLLTILMRGVAGRPYNVGSDTPITISRLAQEVVDAVDPRLSICYSGADSASASNEVDYYVPNTDRASAEFGLRATVALADGIARTRQWHSGDWRASRGAE